MKTLAKRVLIVCLLFAALPCGAGSRPVLTGDPVHDQTQLRSLQRPEDALALLPEDATLAIDIIAAWLQSGPESRPENNDAPAGEVIPPPPVMRVGGDENCQFGSIQAAIDAASGAVEVRVARNQFYTAQELVIQNKDITLRGGFADCGAGIMSTRETEGMSCRTAQDTQETGPEMVGHGAVRLARKYDCRGRRFRVVRHVRRHSSIASFGFAENRAACITCAIGQWDATEARQLSGGDWRLTGGFWGMTLEELADLLFSDRFETDEL